MSTLSPDQLKQLIDSFQVVAQQLKTSSGASINSATLASTLEARIGKFYFDAEGGNTFDNWYKRYGNFIEIDGKDLDESAKVRLLVGKLGDQEYSRLANSVLPKLPDQLKFKEVTEKLNTLFADSKSLFVRRFECFQFKQQPGQDIGTFISSVNASCETANLSLSKETLKCMIMVVGIRDEYHDLRQKCLQILEEARKRNEEISLDKLGEECRSFPLLRESARSLSIVANGTPATNALSAKPQKWRENKPTVRNKINPKQSSHKQKNNSPSTPCLSCGNKGHWRSECQQRWSNCLKCGKKGHISAVCRSSNFQGNKKPPAIHHISFGPECLGTDFKNSDWWTVNPLINGIPCEMKIDTGSQISVFTSKTWKHLNSPKLEKVYFSAKNCNGAPFILRGKFKCNVQHKTTQSTELVGYVSDHIVHDLLGLPWIKALDILQTESFCSNINTAKPLKSTLKAIKDESSLGKSLQNNFKDVFGPGLGHCTKMKAHLHLKPEAKPIFCKARPVPYGATEEVNAELDRLLAIGSLKKIDFSDWAAPIPAVKKKNGNIRVCIDFSTGLNNALELNRHPLPRVEDIYASISGAKFFSQLDLRDAYLQIELDDESKKLCGVNTHRGIMQCQRLPFGVKSAPAIFQQLMDQMLSGIPGAFAYLDDIVIASPSMEKHIETIFELFSQIQRFGLKIHLEKCSFLKKEIKFIGHIVNSSGIRPDPARTEAIRQMPAPTDITSLRSFLGAINYYGRFIKSMREIREPLDKLTRKDIAWEWSSEQETAFAKAKQILTSDLLLTHYDPKLPIVVAADASKNGIGSTISHMFPDKSEKVIEHASVSFSSAQQNYSQIEKEALALVFAVQKFHKMLYGRKFTLQTDHKPLLAIFGSKNRIPIYTASRLQRWAITLSNYDFDIKYVNTESFGKVDVLSRLIAEYPRPEEDKLIANICSETEHYVNAICENSTSVLPITATEIANKTSQDPILLKVCNFIQTGWPQKCKDPDLTPFFPKRNQLSIVENCVLYGHRTIIPPTLQQSVLKAMHLAHPGISKMKAIAMEHVYWPGINLEIERLVRSCEDCQNAAKVSTKVPLCTWPVPKQVFERVHIDFAGPCSDGFTYLIIVDAYSKWPEVYRMQNTSSKETIRTLQLLANRLGLPKEIVSDNGPQFRSFEFATFCKQNGIKHTFTPPYHPQSNGQAERFVDTFKRAMKKCQREGKDWAEKALLAYRTTPHQAIDGYSPDQLFLGRRLRTKLTLLHPDEKIVKEKVSATLPLKRQEYNSKMTKSFQQKHGAKQSEFCPGESIYLLNYRYGKTMWIPGKVITRIKNSPTYKISVPSIGHDVHRHANQLRRRLPIELDDDEVTDPEEPPITHEEDARDELPSPHKPIEKPPARQSPRAKRERRPPRRLELDPQQKTYTYVR
ncbi:hypothetical protein ACQ4LE_010332 [Meloidogyne hapla]